MSVWAWAFWAAIATLAFTYAGYPLWLALRTRRRAVTGSDWREPPEVVMIVVAHDEAGRIADKIRTCLAQDYPADRLSVLVVSDGSTDATVDIVSRWPDPRVRVLACAQRRGKASCLNDGVAASTAPVIVFTDARQRLSPQAVRRLVDRLGEPGTGAVSGELVFVDDAGSPFAEGMGAYWRYEKFIRVHEGLTGSVVGVTGALYALRRECFVPLPAPTILDDVLVPMRAAMAGWRVGFEREAVAYDRPSSAPAQERLRKVRTLAGNFQLLALCPALAVPWRNPLWGRFVAHKLLRLAGPPCLLVALVGGAGAAWHDGPWHQGLFAAQLLAWLVVAAGLLLPRTQAFAPVRLAVLFAHLNHFVVLGAWSYFRGRQAHLWQKSAATAPPGEDRLRGDSS